MVNKRRLSCDDCEAGPSTQPIRHGANQDIYAPSPSSSTSLQSQPAKRHRPDRTSPSHPPRRDVISTLSDEILLRVFTHFGVREILDISRVSKRFQRLTSDSQIWRFHFWDRFIRPRAELIRGSRKTSHRLNFDGRRSIYADGGFGRSSGLIGPKDTSQNIPQTADWKGTYKTRHNWERGRCYVDELELLNDAEWSTTPERKTYAQFVDGLAVTVDSCGNLRAWDLRSRKLLAHAFLDPSDRGGARPLSLALDSKQLPSGFLDIAVGFEDGTFDIWSLNVANEILTLRYRHQQRLFGPVIAVAYMHPYVLTARRTGFVVLFSFNWAEIDATHPDPLGQYHACSFPEELTASDEPDSVLPIPRILDTTKSSNVVPQAVAIRQVSSSFIASVAYSFQTMGGWSIGIQDIDIRPSARLKLDAVTSRLTYTLPTPNRKLGPPMPQHFRGTTHHDHGYDADSDTDPSEEDEAEEELGRPTNLCYSHPYLLATLPDNTLMLHMCTATADSLSISDGVRLWGHTSTISDAVITPWGRAVSVTARGDQMRLWKVEGGIDNGSVEVQVVPDKGKASATASSSSSSSSPSRNNSNFADKRTWVAFDEERVIALKERPDGRESFMVYDFT